MPLFVESVRCLPFHSFWHFGGSYCQRSSIAMEVPLWWQPLYSKSAWTYWHRPSGTHSKLGLVFLFISLHGPTNKPSLLHCCIGDVLQAWQIRHENLFWFVCSFPFHEIRIKPLSEVGGNLGNEILRKWMKAPSDHTLSYIWTWNGHWKSKTESIYLWSGFMLLHKRDLITLNNVCFSCQIPTANW